MSRNFALNSWACGHRHSQPRDGFWLGGSPWRRGLGNSRADASRVTPARPPVQRHRAVHLMDDGVVVEPKVGNRVERSLAALDATMHLVWGSGALNLDKLAEGGPP